jgi:hypothetical protein
LARVHAAEGQTLEPEVCLAIEAFIVGCKADGIWTAIKASCILAGARTLTGALVPLVGAAPTNFNFVSGDYNRETGLVGDGSTKYLDSNRNNNADPQDSKHIAVYASEALTENFKSYAGIPNASGSSHLSIVSNTINVRLNTAIGVSSNINTSTGLIGVNRTSSTTVNIRSGGSAGSFTSTSDTPASGSLLVFDGIASGISDARLAFYSIGEALDLALLDARVTDLINAFGAAIP